MIVPDMTMLQVRAKVYEAMIEQVRVGLDSREDVVGYRKNHMFPCSDGLMVAAEREGVAAVRSTSGMTAKRDRVVPVARRHAPPGRRSSVGDSRVKFSVVQQEGQLWH